MKDDILLENFGKAIARKRIESKKCECGEKMAYDMKEGVYRCPACQNEEQDMYGFLKDVLKKYPMMNKYDLVNLLGIPLRVINAYFEDGVLVNPVRAYYS